jgi:hypothetical protein
VLPLPFSLTPGENAAGGEVVANRVFLSKAYGRGAALVELLRHRRGGTYETNTLWRSSRVMRTKFTNVAVWEGHVYGLSGGILECIDLYSGERIWKSGRYGHGQILRVGELLLVLAESGRMAPVEATPLRPNSTLGRFQAIEGKTWNTMAQYGPYLLVRNAQQAACYKFPLQEPKGIATMPGGGNPEPAPGDAAPGRSPTGRHHGSSGSLGLERHSSFECQPGTVGADRIRR